ncbi:flavin reductase family protein [Streptomyces sp. NBC_01387]|uniref:flavin reductase family protein n=1 Tax=unclassified Streptomyces TaxID=2593676 RepID=UPI002DDA883E|nr:MULTISPECIES: flavin reductase family protein [unclassified Streptomyces]WSC24142.1 flavin reductase family protein [Streptomyces sp. NBC_01766]WSV58029.1 flavin reductase family protein [Streptomyces sp. NBC_01014]
MPAEALSRTAPADVRTPSPAELRTAMGRFASGVTVVTGHDEEGPAGFACQSFASVSLEPPLVLFCADHRGRAWPRIRATGRFCVNVLAAHQTEVCARFGSSRGRKFDGLDWRLSRWGAPALPGVLLRVHASVDSVRAAGDHDVVLGRVLELDTPGEEPPMIFYRGGFDLGRDTAPQGAGTGPALPPVWGPGDRWG